MTPIQQFAQQLNDFLEYKKEEGFKTLEIAPETLASWEPAPPLAKKGAVSYSSNSGITEQASPLKSEVCVTGKTLADLVGQIHLCAACPLHASRNQTVPGEGHSSQPDIMFIGEGPGVDEDAQGRPFVGAAGQLLDKMIQAMGYQRGEVFIANIVKCRPPGNRAPLPEEMAACVPYLRAQIALIQPKLIIALGKTAVEGLLQKTVAITKFRGTWCQYEGIDLMPTYHPAYLLRSPGKKGEAWADLKAALAKLGKEPPAKISA